VSTIFTKAPSFIGATYTADSDTSAINGAIGYSTNTLMVGEDGNFYYLTFGFYPGFNPNNNSIVCAQTGNVNLITLARLAADGAVSGSETYIYLPCAGTKYFWVIGIESTGHVTLLYSGVLYKIENDTTFTKVGGFAQYDTRDVGPGGLFSQLGTYSIQTNAAKNRVYFSSSLSLWDASAAQHRCGIASLPISEETFVTPLLWDVSHSLLTDNFYNYANNTGNHQALTLIPDISSLGYHYLLTVRQKDYDYMSSHLGESTSYSLFTRPGIYMWRPDTEVLTDLTDTFGVTDFGTHLDNSSSSDAKDDYVGCSTFSFDNRQYVCFNRSYSLRADLMTLNTGTYVHTTIFDWDSEEADKVYDDHSALFNVLTDTGSSLAGTYAPNTVQVGLLGSTLYYLWGNVNLAGGQADVVGGLLGLASDNPGAYHAYFSEFRNPDYIDWDAAGGADFSSDLYTSFYLSSENSLFMEAPWVISYLDNTTDFIVDQSEVQIVDELGNSVYVMPSLLLTPKWDWTESLSNFKSGPTLDVYQLRTKTTVSDKRTRVRGKGRALQLHWQSTSHKPFNLLGWSIIVDENATY